MDDPRGIRGALSELATHSGRKAEGLGSLIFEHRPRVGCVVAMAFGLPVFFGALALLSLTRGKDTDAWILAGVVLFLSLFGCLALWTARRMGFRCYEHGLRITGAQAERVLRYEEIVHFQYSTAQLIIGGVIPAGSTIHLSFTPSDGGPPIRYEIPALRSNELESVRKHLSKVLAREWARAISQELRVPWTRHLDLDLSGVHWGSKRQNLLRFDDVRKWELDAGKFSVWKVCEDRPLFSEDTNESDFYLGYVIFERCAAAAQGS